MNEDQLVVIAEGFTLERFGDDAFFVDVRGLGHRTVKQADEVILHAFLSELYRVKVRGE